MKEKRKPDFISEMENMLPKEMVEEARKEAEQEIFKINLSKLRKDMGVTQDNIKNFSQSGISKIENRKDMKISTLINYLDSIGMNIEIKVYPKNKKSKEILLLKT